MQTVHFVVFAQLCLDMWDISVGPSTACDGRDITLSQIIDLLSLELSIFIGSSFLGFQLYLKVIETDFLL